MWKKLGKSHKIPWTKLRKIKVGKLNSRKKLTKNQRKLVQNEENWKKLDINLEKTRKKSLKNIKN